jgi:hypothetical protein
MFKLNNKFIIITGGGLLLSYVYMSNMLNIKKNYVTGYEFKNKKVVKDIYNNYNDQTYKININTFVDEFYYIKLIFMIEKNPDILKYIKNQTPDICLAAVKQDGMTLQYVQSQTPDICLAAVEQTGMALQYVQSQTPDICLAAVKQDGMALQYVQSQTPDMCLAAVKQDGMVLKHVQNKTEEICIAAVEQNRDALRYVPMAHQGRFEYIKRHYYTCNF